MSAPQKFRKKPVTIEAMQWAGEPDGELEIWLGDSFVSWIPSRQKLAIQTLEGEITASPGDWIIRDSGGFYPCMPDIFAATYEEAE